MITCVLVIPVAASAAPAPGARIDLKVLVAGPNAADSVLASWQAALKREGVPFDTYVESATTPLSDATLADYAGNHAKYNAVILAYGDMLSPTEQAALTKYQQTFGVRVISDNVASAAHGLTLASSGEQGGQTGTLTPDGKAVFPYLTGNVPISAPSFGYQAKPTDPKAFTTLLGGPNGSAYLGVYTHADGTQEMVNTVPGSPFSTQNQLLRHGMISWATRGVSFGTQRNYLATQIDDVFLGDDAWIPVGGVPTTGRTCIPVPETTSACPEDQIQLAGADVATARKWMSDNGLRLDMVFNGGGTDPGDVLAAFKQDPSTFGWINHTFDHPNLDCSTTGFIANEITQNTNWARQNGLPIVPSELVTGEHSGLANTAPGNPGTIDPPMFDDADVVPSAGATLNGTYDYAITGTTSLGETVPSTTTLAATTGNGVQLTFPAVCHTTSYKVYRRTATTGAWALIGTVNQPATAFNDLGPIALTFTDTGAAGSAATPPTANTASESPYPQNPNFVAALNQAGITNTATDASKAYPNPPTATVPATANFTAGQSFLSGTIRAVPRYPTNIYYNTETQTQQLDEYNYLYNVNRGCKPIQGVTTCNTADVTWQQLIDSETAVMMRHIMGNDPRPHYFHESNIASSTVAGGGVFYSLINNVLAQYRGAFSTPLVQLSPTQIGNELARQDAWSAAVTAGQASAYLQDGQVHVTTTQPLDVPLTGTTVGDLYGGERSGWTSVNGSATFAVGNPVPPPPPPAGTAPPAGSNPAGSRPAGKIGIGDGISGGATSFVKLTRLTISPRRFHASGRRSGTTINWTASDTGKLDATVRRVTSGRRVKGLCKALSRSNRKSRACTRMVSVGTLKLTVKAGKGKTHFSGRIKGRALKPGTYQLVAGSRTATFTVTTTRVKTA